MSISHFIPMMELMIVWTPLILATMGEESLKGFGPTSKCFSLIMTDFSHSIKNSKGRKLTAAPIGRAGQPIEVATPFVFLASADSSYFTAQVSLFECICADADSSASTSTEVVLTRCGIVKKLQYNCYGKR